MTPPQNTALRLHGSLNMTCIAVGTPEPSITWHKDNIPGHTLQFYYIPAVQVVDRGFYYCTAENTAPSDDNTGVFLLVRELSEKVVINIIVKEKNHCSCHCVRATPN